MADFKSYASKSGAKRAAESDEFTQIELTEDNIGEHTTDESLIGRWVNVIDEIGNIIVESQDVIDGSDTPADVIAAAIESVDDSPPMNTLLANREHSTIEKPVAVVHRVTNELLDENPETRRKDIILACVELGVNIYTARTQVQIALVNRRKRGVVASV